MLLDRDFVRIAADWDTDVALEVVRSVKAGRVVVQRVDPHHEYFYVYDVGDMLHRLSGHRRTVFEALDLHEWKAAPTATSHVSGPAAPAVVIDGVRIVGLSRASQQGTLRSTRVDSVATPLVSRALTASAPAEIAVGVEASLLVKITSDISLPGSLAFTISDGDEVGVVLQASGAAAIKGDSEVTLIVTGTKEIVHRFMLVGRTLGEAKVTVYAFKGGQSLGSVAVTTRVVQTVSDTNPIEHAADIRLGADLPDLSLLVFEDKDARSYRMRLTAPRLGINFAPFGPIRLNQGVEGFFSAFYRDIEGILSSNASAREKTDQLAVKGTYLFEQVVPLDLRKQLWGLRRRIRSVEIQSEEPWIPWELCKLTGDDNGNIVEGDFLCEEFHVTRWLLGISQHVDLTLRAIGLVVPGASGLPAAPAERDYVLALASGGRTVTKIPPRAGDLRKALASATYDGIHFTGHGNFVATDADRSALELENGGGFSPQDLSGVVANLGRKRPLVFLNACEVGRPGTSLVGMGGWAQGFLKAGAGAL